MTDSIARHDPLDLTGVRHHQDYARALARLVEQVRHYASRCCRRPRPTR